ncbi:hypothetical protein P152DRAFT_463806 [Eremomyces bilateralis CBS 781.70]|uniref:Dilute domain-containing protein n=1 Tax=Eremomyces bilateralis CBS 781.70 TaxID=1392243 RepID=A0A6G1GDP8_9PEZI|nr:uncharacterized protein P152DRAFT_463806 [Eremomyces bilateralis CBS 781.70]KAF1816144.1 hypothetical protein P152DRAFT_463806 [Eremomyces bilateralis CBS 781.70]
MEGYGSDDNEFVDAPEKRASRQLPADLPTSLDDRRTPAIHSTETEIYDAWQGQSQFLTTPVPAKPFNFNLALDEPDATTAQHLEDNENKMVEMLANQARLKSDSAGGNEVAILKDEKLSESERRDILQGMLNMAASNGEAERVRTLVTGPTKEYVDVDAPDQEGTPPLIYASCFGHQEVVAALLDAGADVDKRDKNQWTALMWALIDATSKHKAIAKLLLDHGANPDVKSSSGRSALDFIPPNGDISAYLHGSGYSIGSAGMTDDFYDRGLSQDRFEEELAESELRRRMMMESAINLEVDLGNLGLDEQPETLEELEEEGQEFIWDRCLNDQMFVFQEPDLERILDIIITNMTPQRSPSQKPVPANILFLAARYAHYYVGPELLEKLLVTAMDKINNVVERHQWDMTILAFWISNATLLLHYLRKDAQLVESTVEFQEQLADLINEIFILIIRDAERRMDKVLDAAMLDHETIPGFEGVHFQNEWKIFRTKPKIKEEPPEKRFRPPSPKRRALPSPRNITSLLSSTLFVLDLYDIHSVITAQILSQLLYWLGSELFNRVMSNRKYLARTKAMQIRMNVSSLEDWARANNRQPEHYEHGSVTATGENTVDAAKRHLAPGIQLLQWLQCFSSLGDDLESLVGTLQQLPRLNPQQLLHAVSYYRAEVGEKGLTKSAKDYLGYLHEEHTERKALGKKAAAASHADAPPSPPKPPADGADHPATPHKRQRSSGDQIGTPRTPLTPSQRSLDEAPENLLLDPTHMLPFALPSSTDMLVSYGAGFGGLDRERERKYIPTVPAEFLGKLDAEGGGAKKAKPSGPQLVAADKIDETFGGNSIDLISQPLGSKILAFSDEWFAAAANLTTKTAPVRKPGVFVHSGAWYDGWETRRHNPAPFDWVIIRLGVASGTVTGVEIDTAHFDGNHAPEIAVEGCFAEDDAVVTGEGFEGWETILGKQECGPNRRQAWVLEKATEKAYTHVRLQMYPDGGIARFRLYGQAVPVFPDDKDVVFELSAAVNGGIAVSRSDEHFGVKENLLLPNRGINMGDGWETKRTRGEHVDWVVFRLGAPGTIDHIVIDTGHFRGNFPQKVQVFAIQSEGDPDADDEGWVEVLPPQKSGPDAEHRYEKDLQNIDQAYSHAKLVIIPDGGVSRFRVFGRRSVE